MKRSWHHRLTVLLIAVLLIISLAGEALHLLPGMGHYVRMPSGKCLWLGASQGDEHDLNKPAPVGPGHAWETPKDKRGDILSEDECAICSLLSLSSDPCTVACWTPPTLLFGSSDIYQSPLVLLDEMYLHGARAPPACELYRS